MKCKCLWIGVMAAAAFVLPVATGVATQNAVVIDEDFTGEGGGCNWTQNTGCAPENAGKAGKWLPSGHVPGGGAHTSNTDNDWGALVQSQVGQPSWGSGAPSLSVNATLNRTGTDTGTAGVFNMDSIIKFQLADGTDRSAVAGQKIIGSFRFYRQSGNIGFGFTDDIADLQAFQATMPTWTAGSAPVMMPSPYTTQDWESPDLNPNYDPAHRGFSKSVTGHIGLLSGANGIKTAAVVDMDDNGAVDWNPNAPRTDPASSDGSVGNSQAHVRFEYTVGTADYDLLQIDKVGDGSWEDIVQCNTAACINAGGSPQVPNPGGAFPVGHVKNKIEAMFITVGNFQLTEIWADDFHVEIAPAPEPTSAVLLLLGVVGACTFRQRG